MLLRDYSFQGEIFNGLFCIHGVRQSFFPLAPFSALTSTITMRKLQLISKKVKYGFGFTKAVNCSRHVQSLDGFRPRQTLTQLQCRFLYFLQSNYIHLPMLHTDRWQKIQDKIVLPACEMGGRCSCLKCTCFLGRNNNQNCSQSSTTTASVIRSSHTRQVHRLHLQTVHRSAPIPRPLFERHVSLCQA